MKLSGVMPLRNAVRLGYPFRIALKSLRALCDEVIVLVDPKSDDGTEAAVIALDVADRIVLSEWNMDNHDGHRNCEISVQTQKACDAATGDWIFSLQADEVLHEDEVQRIRESIEVAERNGITGIEMVRLYFFGSLARFRDDWTIWLLRLFKRGMWQPDVDGAMRFDPSPLNPEARRANMSAHMFHYSRIGDPAQIAERVRNLDGFFHEPSKIVSGEIPPYDFALRKLDTYVAGHEAEAAKEAVLVPFPVGDHPVAAREFFNA